MKMVCLSCNFTKKKFNDHLDFFSMKLQHLQDHILNFDQCDFKQKRSNSRSSR